MPKADRQHKTAAKCLKQAAADPSQTKITSLLKEPVPLVIVSAQTEVLVCYVYIMQ